MRQRPAAQLPPAWPAASLPPTWPAAHPSWLRCSARSKLLLPSLSRNAVQATPARTERNSAGGYANAFECQRLTRGAGCTAFYVYLTCKNYLLVTRPAEVPTRWVMQFSHRKTKSACLVTTTAHAPDRARPPIKKKYEKQAKKKNQNLSVEVKRSRVGDCRATRSPPRHYTSSSHARGGGLYAGLLAISTSVWKRSELR